MTTRSSTCLRVASEDGSLTCTRCWLRTGNTLLRGEEHLSELRRERKRVEVVEVSRAVAEFSRPLFQTRHFYIRTKAILLRSTDTNRLRRRRENKRTIGLALSHDVF